METLMSVMKGLSVGDWLNSIILKVCLLPYSDSSGIQEISNFLYLRSVLSVLGSPVRSNYFPQDIHQGPLCHYGSPQA